MIPGGFLDWMITSRVNGIFRSASKGNREYPTNEEARQEAIDSINQLTPFELFEALDDFLEEKAIINGN